MRTQFDNGILKKQIKVSFSCVCPVIDNTFRHNIVVCGTTATDNVMTKFMINNRTDERKTDVNFVKCNAGVALAFLRTQRE